jgi:hypothetical protein
MDDTDDDTEGFQIIEPKEKRRWPCSGKKGC